MKSSSASLPSNTSLHDMINNNNTGNDAYFVILFLGLICSIINYIISSNCSEMTSSLFSAQSDNALHVERKTSRELLTKATSDLNFNPIIEVCT